MLRTLIKQHLPERARQVVKEAYRKFKLVDAEPVSVPFDQLFGEVEKQYYTPPEIIPTPEVLEMPLWDRAASRKSSTYTVPEGFVAILHDVLYYPPVGVIMTDARQVVTESIRYGTEGVEDLRMLKLRSRKVEPISGYCARLGVDSNYYHQLIDSLPQLAALNRPPFSDLEEIKLLGANSTSVEKFLLTKIAPDNARIFTPKKEIPKEADLYRIEHFILLPHRTRRFSAYLPRELVAAFREKVLPNRPSTREHRIFISRENSPRRRVENREELMAALKKRGFIKVCPEELSPEEEIDLFYDAETVVAAHGSGLTNLLFAQEANVVEMFQTSYVIPHFYYLCKSLGHRYAYWCGGEEGRYPDSSAVDVPAILEILDKMDIR